MDPKEYLTRGSYHHNELVKLPYPPLVRSQYGYVVMRGKGRHQQLLYSGYSHDIARLVINVMPGAHLV